MKSVLFTSLLLLLAPLQAAEPSAFGAGNLDSDKPYGLTETEKSIYQNKKELRELQAENHSNQSQLQSLRERLDGFQTIIEGLNQKAQSNKMTLGELSREQSEKAMSREEKVTALETAVTANAENIAALKKVLETLAGQVDKINADYVSKDEYNRLVSEVNAFKRDVAKTLKSVSAPAASADPYSSISSEELMGQAFENYNKLYFKRAIPQYEELIRRNYKPAEAHFMLGEMWHYRKKWAKALSYFKASASLYDEADYMPALMLHSAECMTHTGDRENAARFLRALMAKYPDSSEAHEADALLDTLP